MGNKNMLTRFKNDQRPRTPVYGMLRFQTFEGYKRAVDDSLVVLGTVIRRHPVLSIQPRNAKTLYLEQIPMNLFEADVELKLARLLHPHHIYIGLDGMREM